MTERRSLFLVVLIIAATVCAQSSNVTQCVSEYQWSINPLGQTPCLVGSYLETLCSGKPIAVDALPQGNHYIGPSIANADPCFCNSVTYSMISACAGCQGRLFLNYSAWSASCPLDVPVPIGKFPRIIPAVTQVPSWATLNISLTNSTFSPTEAAEGLVEAARQPKINATSSSPTAASTTTSLPSQSTSDSQGSSGLSSGPIAGITVGALLAVIVTLLALFWLKLRSKKRNNRRPAYHPPEAGASRYHAIHSKPLSGSASVITPYTYNASEGVHQQPPPEIPAMYTTAPQMRPVDNLVRPSIASQVVATAPRTSTLTTPYGYTGVPEV